MGAHIGTYTRPKKDRQPNGDGHLPADGRLPAGWAPEQMTTYSLVHKPGATVTIGDDVPGSIRQVCIASDGVTYEVVWWSGRERKTAWLSAHEVRDGSPEEIRIGFKT